MPVIKKEYLSADIVPSSEHVSYSLKKKKIPKKEFKVENVKEIKKFC